MTIRDHRARRKICNPVGRVVLRPPNRETKTVLVATLQF